MRQGDGRRSDRRHFCEGDPRKMAPGGVARAPLRLRTAIAMREVGRRGVCRRVCD
jgi:hypothetical protein